MDKGDLREIDLLAPHPREAQAEPEHLRRGVERRFGLELHDGGAGAGVPLRRALGEARVR